MCTKHSCPYSHAAVDPSAPLCRTFAYLGYCAKGADCGQKHLRECPDYGTSSGCRLKHCPLPHVDRASQMRRSAANHLGNPGDMDVDMTSEEEANDNANDMDSDDEEEPEEFFGTSTYEFPQHQDFVGLT
jgi:hypothetical protein